MIEASLDDVFPPVTKGLTLTFILGVGTIAAGVLSHDAGFLTPFGVALAMMWPLTTIIYACFIVAVFVKEIVVEIVYLCQRQNRKGLKRHDVSEISPLVSAGHLPTSEPRRLAQTICEYLAVVIDDIDLTNAKNGVFVKALPTKPIRLPVDNISQVAVISWRWDFDQDAFKEPSKNLAAAIKCAKLTNIKYLFADIIAVDQTLPGCEKIKSVMEFSKLYQTIPVIAAYDQTLCSVEENMFRPWIFSETRLMSQNPTRIMYAGHNKQGAYIRSSAFFYFLRRLPRSRVGDTNFAKHLHISWSTDFVTSVMQVLNGTVSMADIYDFKLILPAFANVFTVAEQLDRNDYLLTVALLASSSTYRINPKHRFDDQFTRLYYKRYGIKSDIYRKLHESVSFHGSDDEDYDYWTSHHETQTVYLGPVKVARFHYYEKKWDKDCIPLYRLTVFPNIEQKILHMLGLDNSAIEQYFSDEPERRACLRLPSEGKRPDLEVTAVKL